MTVFQIIGDRSENTRTHDLPMKMRVGSDQIQNIELLVLEGVDLESPKAESRLSAVHL
jgi:hypothetical protein